MNRLHACGLIFVCLAATRVSAEALVVSSNRQLTEDVTCSGISFTGGYTLSAADGVKVTVAAGGGITVSSGTATLSCPVQFGPTTDGETIDASEAKIAVASGAKLVISASACLSGDAKIVIDQPGTIDMYADNTFNGSCLIKNGFLNLYSDGAFGTRRGGTTYDCTGRSSGQIRINFYGVTITDDFTANCKDISTTANFYPGTSGVTDFSGKFTAPSNFRWDVQANSTVRFSGLSHTNDFINSCLIFGLKNATTSKLVFDSPSYFGHWYTGSGVVEFNQPVAVSPYRGIDSYMNTFRMGMANVFARLPYSNFSNKTGSYLSIDQDGMTFDLNGYDQELYFIKESYTTFQKSVITSPTATPATLRLRGTNPLSSWEKGGVTATTYSGKFTGAVGLTVEGGETVAKTKPLTLNGTSTSTGLLCVTNGGLLTLSSSASWAGDVRVENERSKLTVANQFGFAESAKVAVSDSGELALTAAGEYVVAEFKINGTALAEGVYAAGAAAFEGLVTGVGSVRVQPTSVTPKTWTWNGAGGDGDLYNADNWAEAGSPDFTDSSVQAAFASSGTTAGFGGTPIFRKITFNAANGFTLATNAASAGLTLANDGLVASDAAATRTYRLLTPVAFTKPQTWNVGAKCEVKVDGPISSDGMLTLTKEGSGKLVLSEPGTWEGYLNHKAGSLQLVGGALHGASGKINVSTGAGVQFAGGTFAQDIWFEALATSTYCMEGTTNVFEGAWDFNGANVEWHMKARSKMVLEKAVLRAGYQTVPRLYGNSELSFEKGFATGNLCCYFSGTDNVVRFGGKGYTFGGTYNFFTGAGRVVLENAWAWDNTNRVWRPLSFGASTVVDLNGYDQGVGGFNSRRDKSTASAITSAKPATLYACQMYGNSEKDDKATSTSADPAFLTKFTGQVSFSKSGTAYLFLGGVSTTTGRLEVTEGTLGFKGSGSWANASEVSVLGGTLAVDEAGRLPKRVQAVRLGKNATLDLAAGVTLRCRKLYVQDSSGAWATANGTFGAGALDGRVTGGGTLLAPGGVIICLE